MPEQVQDVKAILCDWLRANGYDGLFNDDECMCGLERLAPCGAPCAYCRPGYKGPPLPSDREWFIYGSREAAEAAKENTDD